MGIDRKTIKNETSIPSGMIATFWLSAAPEGWVICDGRQYTDKNGYIQTSPNLNGRFPLFANGSIGQFIDSGLPDHTHKITIPRDKCSGTSGNAVLGDESRDGYQELVLRYASETEGVYGRYTNTPEFKNKVVPDCVRLLVCMKI